MADPIPYTVSYSFSDFQSNNPSTPLPGPKVDSELASVASAVAALVATMKDVRRSDGALKNGVVTFDSLALGLQLTFDPTNGQLVANSIIGAQASATGASSSAAAASASAGNAATSATNAAASAASVNLSLFLPKAGNLAGIGSADTARANLQAPKVDGSDLTGRLAPIALGGAADWNTCDKNGWYANSTGTANGPDTATTWIAEVIAFDAFWITQIAYGFSSASTSTSAVQIFRRHSYNNAGVRAWQPWESAQPVAVGSTIWVNAINPPPGYLKENGALLSRAAFPALWAFASSSGSLVSEATWAGGGSGGFSTGDLSTTFRLPDARGEFIRAFDDGRGADAGRTIASHQADSLKDHTHNYLAAVDSANRVSGAGNLVLPTISGTSTASSGASIGAAETRPRNNVKLACIKY